MLKRQEVKLGRQHPDALLTITNLGVNYLDTGRLKEAITLLEEANNSKQSLDRLRVVRVSLLDAYTQAGKSAEAAKLVQKQLAEARKALPKDSSQLAGILAQSSRTLLTLKAYADAEPLLRECLAIREKTEPDSWTTFNLQVDARRRPARSEEIGRG